MFYYTQIIGDAINPPTLLASASFGSSTLAAVIGVWYAFARLNLVTRSLSQMPIPIFPAEMDRNIG